MHIGLQSWGTEGDLRPFLALARALLDRGHSVEVLFTGVEGKDISLLCRSAGVEVRHLDGDGYFVRHREELARLARQSQDTGNPARQLELILSDLMDPVIEQMHDAARELAARSDVLCGHVLVPPLAVAAEEHERPFVQLALQPIYSSVHYPPSGAPSLGKLGNRITWRLAQYVMKRSLLPRVNRLRGRSGMSPLRQFQTLNLGRPRQVLVAVSPTLFPRPPDWPEHIAVTGALPLQAPETTWVPSGPLSEFLAEGAPVFLSFGSMFSLGEEQTLEALFIFAEALRLAGARGVIQAPPSVIAKAPQRDDLFYLDRAPHDQLFPLCSAIVHHGGAGTTQSALRSGRGSVVVPHAADQFYFADLLRSRGVGSKPLRRTKLSAPALAHRIRQVLDDPDLPGRAAALSQSLLAEDGAALAVERIERAAR